MKSAALLIVAIVIFLLLFPVRVVYGVSASGDFDFECLSREHGLYRDTVLSIMQDKEGFMWFGVEGAVQKFDGYRFTDFYHEEAIPGSLANGDKLHALLEDGKGHIWVATDAGLDRFDIKKQTFTHFIHKSDDPRSLSHNYVQALLLESSGVLWVGTFGGGLNKFDEATGTFTRVGNGKGKPGAGLLIHHEIIALAEGKKGVIWIATNGGGLCAYEPASGRIAHYRKNPGDPNSLYDDSLFSLMVDRAGMVWCGFNDGVVMRLDPINGTTTRFFPFKDHPKGLGLCRTICMYNDSRGDFWFGSLAHGLSHYNPSSGVFTNYDVNPLEPGGIGDSSIRVIYEDKSGVLWFGSHRKGIFKLDRNKKKFALVRHEPGNPNSINHDYIASIYEDRDGVVWIGFENRGLTRWDRKNNTFNHYLAEGGAPGDPRFLAESSVVNIFQDKSGQLWFCTPKKGVDRFDPQTGLFAHYPHTPGNPAGLSHEYATSVRQDKSGTIWVGTLDGLNRLNPDNRTFTRFSASSDNKSPVSRDAIIAMFYEEPSNELFIGYEAGGLSIFSIDQKQFSHHRFGGGIPGGLNDSDISAIIKTIKGEFWVGTLGGGISRFDRKTGKFSAFTTRQGLADNYIQGILEDNRGMLWLSSKKGITRFNPQDGAVRNYGVNDGLQGLEYSIWTCFKNKRGEMYFGGTEGLNLFDPEAIRDNPFVPAVTFTDLKIFEKYAEIGQNGRLKSPMPYLNKIVMDYTENIFSLEFAALEYSAPQRNQFRYMVEGLQDKWISLGNKHDISFTDLDPGSYILRVMGSNNDGVWNTAGVAIEIVITPPFWQSLWFRALALLCVLMILLFWHRMRMANLSLRIRTEAEVTRLMEKFSISEREREIVNLILKGKSNKDIEEELYISSHTVKNHIYRIYKKLGVQSRTELLHLVQKPVNPK